MSNAPAEDTANLRAFMNQRVGASWFSLLIEPERDGLGSHVTIQPQYIGRDETANYLQTRELPEAEARALFRLLGTYDAAGGLNTYERNVNGETIRFGVVRTPIERAQKLLENQEFIAATNEQSLLEQLRDGTLTKWALRITPQAAQIER